MKDNHRSQTEKNKSIHTTAVSSGAAAGPADSSDVLSPAYRTMTHLDSTRQQQTNAAKLDLKIRPEHERVGSRAGVQRGHRQNKSIAAAHPAIYLNTRSHKLLRRAVRIWKMPVPILNFTGSSKPRNFQEQLKRVEMLRSRSVRPTARSVRDLQLCSSGTDSSPSPCSSSESRCRRTAHAYRTRRYRKQLRWYRTLSCNKRRRQGDEKLHRDEDDRRDSSSSQSSPVIQAPARKTSRRLWRRLLDSSSSDSSPMTSNPANERKNFRVSFSFAEEWNESMVLAGDSNLSNEAPASKTSVQTDEKPTPRTLEITATIMDEQTSPDLQNDSAASLVSQMKIFKDELKHCKDITQQSLSLRITTPSRFASTHSRSSSDALQTVKSGVKWKSVLLQRAQCSEDRDPTHRPGLTPEDRSTSEGGSDAERAEKKPQSSAEDRLENASAGDSLTPQ